MKNVILVGDTLNTLRRIELDAALKEINFTVDYVNSQRRAGYRADVDPLSTPFGYICGPTTEEWISANRLEDEPRDYFEWRGVGFVIVGARCQELIDALSI